jgi:hypothetical protein
MNRRLVRRLALALIAVLAFAQASVALAACSMERGEMAQMSSGADCCGGVEVKLSALPNDCVAHCTSDLQLSGLPVVLVQAPAATQLFMLPRVPDRIAARHEPPLRAAPPRRILLHSFLI